MNISFGFFVVVILILFPGLLFRRLFYYGEFSKEFKAGHNLIGLLAVSSVPGLIILVLTFVTYNYLFVAIDIGQIVDKLKDLTSPEFRLTKSPETPINELVNYKAAPFIGFLYLTSILLGLLAGRLIRISRLDTHFKLLRFKNYWFYLLNGQQFDFKKLRHLKESNKKHVFTKADILIDSNTKTHLYSGIVVDYELRDDDCTALSKVMLQNAERYSIREGKRVAVEVPGTILVVDCKTMKNINLTYIYDESKSILQSKLPGTIEVIFGFLIILLIPIFIFKAERFDWSIYNWYFSLPWYTKVLSYFFTIQAISLLMPFVKRKDEYRYVTFKLFLGKLVWVLCIAGLIWILS